MPASSRFSRMPLCLPVRYIPEGMLLAGNSQNCPGIFRETCKVYLLLRSNNISSNPSSKSIKALFTFFNSNRTLITLGILIACNHKNSRAALSSNNSTPGQKHAPNSIPPGFVAAQDFVFIAYPVFIPLLNCFSVMHSHVFNSVDFKACSFQVAYYKSKWAGSVSAWEDVSSHEKSPD